MFFLTNLLAFVLCWSLFDSKDRDGPWLGMHNARTGSGSSKAEKPNSRDCSAAAMPIPESAPMDNTWPESYDPPPKSKGKSVKLKKNLKTDNSKKLISQGSKESVVLVGYKNLKAPYGDASTKYKEGDAPLYQEEDRNNSTGASSGYLRTNANSASDSGATSALSGSAVDSVADDNITAAACKKGVFNISTNFNAQTHPQAGTEGLTTCNQPPHKDDKPDHSGQKLPHWSTGLKQIEVKPSKKDPYQGEKVTVHLPCPTDRILIGNVPEIAQAELCDPKLTVADSVFEKPNKEAAHHSQSCLVSVQVRSDCIRLPDGVPSASSRLSDSGIESEPSSFATQLFPGLQTYAGPSVVDSGASQPERPLPSPAPRSLQQSSMKRPSGATDILYPENTSTVSGVQSSLTSINSLPSDDECEGSSRASSGAEVHSRKSSVLVQEQSVVFSGDATYKPACDVPGPLDTAAGDSQLLKPSFLEADPKVTGTSDPGLEAVSGSGGVKEAQSEPHTACPSSNSATSSTDLVKRGMVENYFGSCSSTDVSEISPVETSAITLGVQAGPQVEEDEDETEHEMIENGYYEEGDGYAFVNGIVDEDRSGVGDAAAQQTSVLFEQLGIGYLHETKDLSKAPIGSNLASGSAWPGSGRPPRLSTFPSVSLRWFECAPTPQMKA